MTEIENPFDDVVDIEITDSFDLHSFQPSEVKLATEAYLTEAKAKKFGQVRIIHGKGIGVQREIVRKVLEQSDFVQSFKTADEFSGSWGATIVKLKIS